MTDTTVIYLDKDQEEQAERIAFEEDEIINLLDSLIARGIREGASDLHIEPTYDSVNVRMRIDGMLTKARTFSGDIHEALVSRIKILSELKITERRRPQDGVIFVKYKKKDVDLRIATSPTIYGESVSFRLLDQGRAGVELDELGFTQNDMEKTLATLDEPYGFILSTGPTGSGKTTTMYALLNQLDENEKKIITIEDPVEYRVDGITQIPVNRRIDLGFAELLRSVLRQDPDVILIGEIWTRRPPTWESRPPLPVISCSAPCAPPAPRRSCFA